MRTWRRLQRHLSDHTPMQQSLIGVEPKSSSPQRPPTCGGQLLSLLWRKEVPLKFRRPVTTVCEVLLPVVLCGLILLSRLAPDMQVKVGNLTYVQPDFEQAAESLGPVSFGEAQFAARARADDITDVLASRNDSNLTGVPNAIFPLEIYLLYAREQGIAPFDGTFLAVAPSTPAVYQLLNDSIPWFNTSVGEYDRPKGSSKALRIRYYDDGDALVAAALKGSSIWCGLIFDGVPPAANWSFTLRLNHSLVPPTTRTLDKFTPALSIKYTKYYASGFLSLQTAISNQIVRRAVNASASSLFPGSLIPNFPGPDGLGNFIYAAPYPTTAYANNRFLDHAGTLVGLVIVLSFIIPLATMLRALVLEKESKLREGT